MGLPKSAQKSIYFYFAQCTLCKVKRISKKTSDSAYLSQINENLRNLLHIITQKSANQKKTHEKRATLPYFKRYVSLELVYLKNILC